MINGRIYNYFSQKPNIRVATITAKDIQEFYDFMFAENCTANTVIHYHAILRKAFSQAVKTEPLNDTWWTRLGYVREMTKNYKLSAIAYDKAISLNNLNAEAKRGKDRVMKNIR